MSNYITGATTALITPFKNGTLDEATYANLIKRQIAHGIDAVCPVGTTGESATLSHDERSTQGPRNNLSENRWLNTAVFAHFGLR